MKFDNALLREPWRFEICSITTFAMHPILPETVIDHPILQVHGRIDCVSFELSLCEGHIFFE